MNSEAHHHGAWGLRLTGFDITTSLLVDAPPHWPELEILVRPSSQDPKYPPAGPGEFTLLLCDGGHMRLQWDQARVILTFPTRPSADALVHPYLAPAVALVNSWLGRDTFHAGAVIIGGRAWAILGDREAGKSSALAWFHTHGITVMTDDVLAIAGDIALAGPRCIDLRPEASAHFDLGRDLGVIGLRERRRIDLGPCPAEVPLGGWVYLDWASDYGLHPVDGGTALRRLLGSLGVNVAPDPVKLLDLTALPARRFCRPRSWASLDNSMQRLTEELALLSGVGLR